MGNWKTRALAALAVGAVTLGASAGSARASGSPGFPAGTPGHGCPRGDFCIWPENDFNWNTGPESNGEFSKYGYHNLSGQIGWHLTWNNQYPVDGVDAGVTFCTGYDATGSAYEEFPGDGWGHGLQLGPVNSITLWLPNSHYRDSGLIDCDY